jgi:hypothetical protein
MRPHALWAPIVGLLLWCGCNNNELPQGQGNQVMPNTTVTGAMEGQFLSDVTATYTNKNGVNRTDFHISAGPINELNISTFVVNAAFTGMPTVDHYGQREGRITAGFFMKDGRIFQDTVNSLLEIDITSVSEPFGTPAGTAGYTLGGTSKGWLGATDSGDLVHFIVVF